MHRILIALTVSIAGSNLFAADHHLKAVHDAQTGKIEIFREGESKPLVTQNARPDFRPYLHPIESPDGKGTLTEYSPGHHKHQTGLYWGFTRINGRDYFHHPEGDYWKRVDVKVLEDHGDVVRWQTDYDMLDQSGKTVLTETQTWTMRDEGDEFALDLEWKGTAKTEVTIGKYNYGGLFLRMPWKKGIKGDVVNGARQRNARAEGQRSIWVDVGMQVEGRDDLAHIAIFDHAKNKGYPQPWRVDGQMGVGPVRARMGDWKVEKGKTETIRHKLLVYTGELNDVELTNKFQKYSGSGTWAQWGIAQKEGRAAKFLSPQAAVDSMTLQDGFKANVYASEPMITQPMAFCWDDRGRMWIAENRDYESRGGGFANSGDSRILILEDTDRDGVADSKKVFAEGIPFPSAIAVGFDGLWLGAPPNLLFVPDKDKDDKADMDDIEIRLTGWGIRDRHETLNSFHWGPDGWLYGCQGFATPSKVGKPTGKGRLYKHRDEFPSFEAMGIQDPVDINGGVFRYHPIKDRFEVVAHGFSNPWGIDYDSKGQLFISACVIPHLWHVIPGGIYHRQGGRHFNEHVYSDIRTIADHRHRSAHGGARIYISDAFPEKYHDRIFMANIHEHAVLTDVLVPKGSGFVGKHGDDFMLANNAQWVGFSMEIGPEGGVYVLDWHDADICGKEVLQKETGRVFRLMPERSMASDWPGRYEDLAKMDDLALVKLQESRSAWHARRARVILQHRAAEGSIDNDAKKALATMLKNHEVADYRLRALWAMHVTGQTTERGLLGLLQDEDEYIRAWAVQLLTEEEVTERKSLGRLMQLARDEESPVVRLYLASALQRVPSTAVWAIAHGLVTHAVDASDHNIPKLLWFGIEPQVEDNPSLALGLSEASEIPDLSRFIGRRLADGDKLKELVAGIDKYPRSQHQLLVGMREALEGRKDMKAPEGWQDVYAKLQVRGGETSRVALELAQQFGDTGAVKRLLTSLTDKNGDADARRQALKALAIQQRDELKDQLVALIDDRAVRIEAIRAVASFDEASLSDALLERYGKFSPEEKLEAVQALATRSRYGRSLTEAIKSGSVPKRDVPAYVARQLRRVVGNSFIDVWGPIDALPEDTEASFKKYRELLTAATISQGNPNHGRAIFKQTCYACHKMYGDGGNIGPEITGANRTNTEYLLSNMLTPSAVIQDAYKMTIVLTDEGRNYSGIIAAENDRQISLKVAGQNEPVIISKASIESREVAPISMMPEGLLRNLSDEEVRDLVAYLQTSSQVPLPSKN